MGLPHCTHLPLLDHVHQFNPGQRFLCGVKTLESQHRTTLALDTPVILFNDVVEILALTDLTALAVGVIVVVDRGCICTTFIDIDEAGFAIPFNRLDQKP